MTELYRWRTLPTGQIEINGRVPLTHATMQQGLPESVWRWRDLARKYGQKYNVPVPWILGIIFAESSGNPNALNTSDSPHGAGLMQITHPSLRGGRTDAELMDPDVNLDIGVGLLGRLRASGDPSARDLPAVASRYNAGTSKTGKPHPGPPPWGMRATGSHIDRVVIASNAAVARMRAEAGGEVATKDDKGDVLPFVLLFQLLRFLN